MDVDQSTNQWRLPMTNLDIVSNEIRELNADELEIVSGASPKLARLAVKAVMVLNDATGGSINMSRMCDWLRENH
jgi:hypothetical protein